MIVKQPDENCSPLTSSKGLDSKSRGVSTRENPVKMEDADVVIKKRTHGDIPGADGPKKTCRQPSLDLEQDQPSSDLLERLKTGTRIPNIVATAGSINEILRLVAYLFQSQRVDAWALDFFLEFWGCFPEAAQSQMELFRLHGCWQQLIQFMEKGLNARFRKHLRREAIQQLSSQWNRDVAALRDYQDGQKESESVATIPNISDLVLCLPPPGSDRDKRLRFVYRMTRFLYPRDKPEKARMRYRQQFNELLETRNRRQPLLQANDEMAVATTDEITTCLTRHNPPVTHSIKATLPRDSVPLYETAMYFSSGESSASDTEGDMVLSIPLDGSIDQHCRSLTVVREAAEDFLNKPEVCLDEGSTERFLYIHQGEVGHAVATQCDVIVSDKATTCHILAFQSRTTDGAAAKLTSLAHIDADCYDNCLISMVATHILHHKNNQEGSKQVGEADKVAIDVHIVGGFDDSRGSSAKISSWLLYCLSWIAETHRDQVTMTVRTCVMTTMNDTGQECPIGRGMGVNLHTGEAFLAKVKGTVSGPASQLRSARLWAGASRGQLAVVHTATSEDFTIEPFEFDHCRFLSEYLRLPDHVMIQRTSTSPDVEEPDFCLSVRNTIRFLRLIRSASIFGEGVNEALVFRRSGTTNVWTSTR